MIDISGREIKRGDWIFYAGRSGSNLHYRFARVLNANDIPKYTWSSREIHRLIIIPILKNWRDEGWYCGIKSYLYNPPLIVDIVPLEVQEALKTHKRYTEWGFE